MRPNLGSCLPFWHSTRSGGRLCWFGFRFGQTVFSFWGMASCTHSFCEVTISKGSRAVSNTLPRLLQQLSGLNSSSPPGAPKIGILGESGQGKHSSQRLAARLLLVAADVSIPLEGSRSLLFAKTVSPFPCCGHCRTEAGIAIRNIHTSCRMDYIRRPEFV